jgi:hypothetical protein
LLQEETLKENNLMEGNMDPKVGGKMSDDRIYCLALVSALLTCVNTNKFPQGSMDLSGYL